MNMAPRLPLRLLIGRWMTGLISAALFALLLAALIWGLAALATAIGIIPAHNGWLVWLGSYLVFFLLFGRFFLFGKRSRNFRLGFAHHFQGHDFLMEQKNELAIPHLEAAVDNFSKIPENPEIRRNLAIDLDDLGLAYARVARHQESLECRLRSLKCFEEMNAQADQAMVWHALGNLYAELGRFKESENAFERALDLARRNNVPWVEAASLDDLAGFYQQRGQYSRAMVMRQQSVDIFQRIKKPAQESLARTRLGHLSLVSEKIPEAVEHCEQAIQAALTAPASAEGLTMLVLGATCVYCEDWAGARQYVCRVLNRTGARDLLHLISINYEGQRNGPGYATSAFAESAAPIHFTSTGTAPEAGENDVIENRDSNSIAASSLYALGLTAISSGIIESPYFDYFSNIWDARQTLLPNMTRIPEADDVIGAGRFSLHGLEKALEMGEKQLAQFTDVRFEERRLAALRQHGAVCAIAGDWESARHYQSEALKLALEKSRNREAAAACFSLGLISIAQSDNMAGVHLEKLGSFLQQPPGTGEPVEDRLRLAYLAFAGGGPEQAVRLIEQAQILARQTNDAQAETHALALAGFLHAGMAKGGLEKAIDWYSRALLPAERVSGDGPAVLRLRMARAECALRLGETENAAPDLDKVMQGLENNQQRLASGEGWARLVHFLPVTRAKAHSLLMNLLVDKRADHAGAYRQIEREQATVYSHLLGQRLLFDPQGNRLRRAASASANARRHALLYPLDEPAVRSAIQARPDRMILAQYAVTEDKTYLFVFDKSEARMRVHEIPVGAGDLRGCLARFEDEVRRYGEYDEPPVMTWQETAGALVAPLAGSLAGCDRLVIVPDRIVRLLPLHAAPLADRPLIAHCPVSYAPSAAGAFYQQPDGARRWEKALCVGICTAGLTKVGEEVADVARLFGVRPLLLGDACMRLWEQPRTENVLHIATHGYFSDDNPFASGLAMSDGILTIERVQEMDLTAQLVTLSACHTGVTPLSNGQELTGFGAAFLVAGASSVIVSLWAVNDEASAALMLRMYELLKTGRSTLAGALREAQLEISRQPRWQHPYFWAPFILMGDGR
jgi:CHAT domain-containing protein